MGWDGIKNYGFGSRPKEVDDEYRKRARGVPKTRVWTRERCEDTLDDLLTILNKILKEDEKINIGDPQKLKNETVMDAITMINKMIDVMNYLYPKPKENVNLNIDLKLDNVIEAWKKKKKEVVLVGDEK